MIRLKQCPVGAKFKYCGVLYIKLLDLVPNMKNYQDNCERLDNHKTIRLHGSTLVKVVEQ